MGDRIPTRKELLAELPPVREVTDAMVSARQTELADARLLVAVGEARWEQLVQRVKNLVLCTACRSLTKRPGYYQRISRVVYKDHVFRCYLEDDTGDGWLEEDPPRPIRVPLRWLNMPLAEVVEELREAHLREATRRGRTP